MADIGRWVGASIGSLVPAANSFSSPNGMFPTEDLNPSSIYGWDSSTSLLTLPGSNLADGYCISARIEYEDTSNGRLNIGARISQASGTGTFGRLNGTGYSRDDSEDRLYVECISFIDNPSASATFAFQWLRGDDGPNTTDGIVRAEICVTPFYYSDIAIYNSTSASDYGGTTPNQVTGFTGTDGTNITISGDVITITGNNKRYLLMGNSSAFGAGSRTQRWAGFDIAGSPEHAAKAYGYMRDASNDRSAEVFTHLLETATADVAIEMFKYRGDGVASFDGGADVDGTTPSFPTHSIIVIELNDSAEVVASTDPTGDQELALTGPVDLNIARTAGVAFNDAASFTRVSDIAFNVEKACDVLFGANIGAAQGTVSATQRWTGHAEVTKNGAEDTTHGFHGNYQRNENGTTDTFGWSANPFGVLDFAADDDIGVSVQELTGTEGGGGNVETQAGWVGFWAINLDTLEAAADVSVTPAAGSLTLTGFAPTVSTPRTVTPGTASLSLTGFTATVSTPIVATPATATLALTGFVPTVTGVAPVTLTPGTGTLALTGFTATVSTPVLVTPATATLVITLYTADVSVSVVVQAIVLSATEPSTAALDALDTATPTLSAALVRAAALDASPPTTATLRATNVDDDAVSLEAVDA